LRIQFVKIRSLVEGAHAAEHLRVAVVFFAGFQIYNEMCLSDTFSETFSLPASRV